MNDQKFSRHVLLSRFTNKCWHMSIHYFPCLCVNRNEVSHGMMYVLDNGPCEIVLLQRKQS